MEHLTSNKCSSSSSSSPIQWRRWRRREKNGQRQQYFFHAQTNHNNWEAENERAREWVKKNENQYKKSMDWKATIHLTRIEWISNPTKNCGVIRISNDLYFLELNAQITLTVTVWVLLWAMTYGCGCDTIENIVCTWMMFHFLLWNLRYIHLRVDWMHTIFCSISMDYWLFPSNWFESGWGQRQR